MMDSKARAIIQADDTLIAGYRECVGLLETAAHEDNELWPLVAAARLRWLYAKFFDNQCPLTPSRRSKAASPLTAT